MLAATSRCYGAEGGKIYPSLHGESRWSPVMTKPKVKTVNDLSRCLDPLDMDATVIAVIEMSQSSWLVAGIVPGVERQPLKKMAIDEHALLKLLSRWRAEAEQKGHRITRIAVAFEAGHDGFWLARWLAAQGIESHVIHASSVAVTREHRRAKSDRLDTELLKRGFLGWLRGERGHCKMVAVPTLAEEDAKRPSRDRETLVGEASRIITRVKAAFVRLGIRSFNPKLKAAAARLGTLRTPEGEPIPPNTLAALKRDLERHRIVKQQIREIERTRLALLEKAPAKGPNAMVLLLARVVGIRRWIEAALDQVVDQCLHHSTVLGCPFHQPERVLEALAIDPKRRHQHEMLTDVDAVDLHHHDVERGQVRTHPFLHARSRQRHEVPRSRRLRHAGPCRRRNIPLGKPHRAAEFPRRDVDQHQVHRPLAEPVLRDRTVPARKRQFLP